MSCFIKPCARLPLYLRFVQSLYLAWWPTWRKAKPNVVRPGEWDLRGNPKSWCDHTRLQSQQRQSRIHEFKANLSQAVPNKQKHPTLFSPWLIQHITTYHLVWTQKFLVLEIIILKIFPCIDKLGTQNSQGSTCLQHLPLSLAAKLTKPPLKFLVPRAAPGFHKYS